MLPQSIDNGTKCEDKPVKGFETPQIRRERLMFAIRPQKKGRLSRLGHWKHTGSSLQSNRHLPDDLLVVFGFGFTFFPAIAYRIECRTTRPNQDSYPNQVMNRLLNPASAM